MNCLTVDAPAKINLTLEVLYRRKDGFHQIKTILQELEFCDTLYLEAVPDGKIELCCEDGFLPRVGSGAAGGAALKGSFFDVSARSLPQGEGNLAFEAACLLQQRYAPRKGARIKLIKRIPIAAGLGGGSSDAAAVLSGLNRLWGLGLKKENLQELGAVLGSDVPFFLYGGTALATGRGELVQPLPPLLQTKVLLAAPRGLTLTAGQVYGFLNLDKIPEENATAQVIQLLQKNFQGNVNTGAEIGRLLCNHLELSVFPRQKEVAVLKEKLLQKGLPALLSGSGPTVFALASETDRLQQTAAALEAEGYSIILTETIKK